LRYANTAHTKATRNIQVSTALLGFGRRGRSASHLRDSREDISESSWVTRFMSIVKGITLDLAMTLSIKLEDANQPFCKTSSKTPCKLLLLRCSLKSWALPIAILAVTEEAYYRPELAVLRPERLDVGPAFRCVNDPSSSLTREHTSICSEDPGVFKGLQLGCADVSDGLDRFHGCDTSILQHNAISVPWYRTRQSARSFCVFCDSARLHDAARCKGL
jgi:hypothetical protein